MQIPEAKAGVKKAILPAGLGWGIYFIRDGRRELTQQTKSQYTAVMAPFPLLLQKTLFFPGIFCFLYFYGEKSTVSNVPHQVSPVKLQNQIRLLGAADISLDPPTPKHTCPQCHLIIV